MICKDCNQEYEQWIPEGCMENDLCLLCHEWYWRMWEKDECTNLREIAKIKEQGHPHHCACRQVWGDGECECDLYAQGYDHYALEI